MDWLIDTADPGSAPGRASSLLEDHLRRHAVDPEGVDPVVRGVRDELADAVRDADGHPLHLRLDPRPGLAFDAGPAETVVPPL